MRAIVYSEAGDPDVLRLVNRPLPEPGPGEVVVAVRVSGVNPTDWKSRRSAPNGALLNHRLKVELARLDVRHERLAAKAGAYGPQN